MLNYFDRRKLEAELEALKREVVNDILDDINYKRNSIEDMESCDRTEKFYNIAD